MGRRLSGTLALLAMDRLEQMFVYQGIEKHLSVYVRFVDDIGATVRKTIEAQKNPNTAQLKTSHNQI